MAPQQPIVAVPQAPWVLHSRARSSPDESRAPKLRQQQQRGDDDESAATRVGW